MLIKKRVKVPIDLSIWIRTEAKRLGTSEESLIRAAIIEYKNKLNVQTFQTTKRSE